jgi:hypothetical protein
MSAQFATSSGEPLQFPEYIQHTHQDYLDGSFSNYPYNIKAYLEAALTAGSPYAGAVAYDPSDDLADARTRIDAHAELVDALDYANVQDMMPLALTVADTLAGSASKIDAMVAAFDEKQKDKLYAALNALCGSLFDTRATGNSQFKMALASLYDSHKREVGEYRANLDMQEEKMREYAALQLLESMMRMHLAKLDADARVTGMVTEADIKKILGMKEYHESEIQLAELDAKWDLELFRYGENMLHALSGVASVGPRYDQRTSGLAGLMSGMGGAASVGVAVGTAMGNPLLGLAAAGLMMGMNFLGGRAQGYTN